MNGQTWERKPFPTFSFMRLAFCSELSYNNFTKTELPGSSANVRSPIYTGARSHFGVSRGGRHNNDKYRRMPPEEHIAGAYGRACRVAALKRRLAL